MKYKIIKNTSKNFSTFKCNGKSDIYLVYNTWYTAKRKGRIFGFWHSLSHTTDYYGESIPYVADTVEEIEEYIKKWHEWKYGNNTEIEIIKEIML